MKTKKPPDKYENIVGCVLAAFAEPMVFQFSDDMDDWSGGEYTRRDLERAAAWMKEMESARNELTAAGSEALPAVRKSLCRIGWLRGREVLLEFLKEFGGEEADREVLRILSTRRRDPLAKAARTLLHQWGEDISKLYPKPRTTPTPTELTFEKKLQELAEMCRIPTNVRKMMEHLRLSNRRHFNRLYLGELLYRELIESCDYHGPNRNSYRLTEKGIEWLDLQPITTSGADNNGAQQDE